MPDSENATIYGVRGRLILATTSQFQIIEVVDTISFGRCLFLDSKIQSAERDEFIYHEILVHPAMITHPSPKSVFIAGGGEGATLREVLRHNTVERVVMVDLDSKVVEVAREHLGPWHMNAFDDPRVEVVFEDARGYLERTDEEFDLAILDTTDPIKEGSAYLLFTQEFYSLLKKRLSTGGIFCTQAGSGNISEISCFGNVFKTIRTEFKEVSPYWAFIPSFFTTWGFVVASDSLNPDRMEEEEIRFRMEKRGVFGLRYYSPKIHILSFEIPSYLREALEGGRKIYDKDPFVY